VERFLAGDHAAAAETHSRLTPLVDALFCTSSPIPLKYALNHLGVSVGPTRLPLVTIDDRSQAIVDAALRVTQIDLPAAAHA
jgi:4-hydroxy-tetrahydrodipicolinate synthase